MYKIQLFIQSLFVVLTFELVYLSQFSHADVGTAAHYRTPYLRKWHWTKVTPLHYCYSKLWALFFIRYTATACYGNDATQFPSSNLFASAGEGIWDNGAACGRQYLVRCISAAHPRTCIPGQTIQIRIVDRALSSVSRPSRHGATIVLSKTAFRMIARPSTSYINIEFQQWVSIIISSFSLFPPQPFNFSSGFWFRISLKFY